MKYLFAAITLSAAACSLPASVLAQNQEGPDEYPMDVVPAADAAELREIAALPDAALIQRLFADAAPGQAPGLQKFFPRGTQVTHLSHGFYGPQTACLRHRSPVACRLHVNDLVEIHTRKSPPGLANNPFERPR